MGISLLWSAAMMEHAHGVLTGNRFLDWFAGNGLYMNLYQCMGRDTLWIALTVALDFAVAAGYVLIALHWWRNQRLLPATPAKTALGNMRNIFVFCGICGYLFIPIKMVWPAWRLYDMFLAVLVYFTWKYAWNARDLKVVYQALGESNRLREDLERSEGELKRKNFFLNAISHDLRTPLNGLVLQANLAELGASTHDTDALRQALQEIKNSARVAGEMLDSFLEYARLDASDGGQNGKAMAGSKTSASASAATPPFNLTDVLRSIVESHQAAARGKGIELTVRAPARLNVRSDRSRVERILNNLLSNALKFTQKGSVRLEVEYAGSNVEIHVIDTGIGIAPEHRERLFEEFYQVHNHERDRNKGFGLGLAIARRLARQLGGDINVESALGNGSRFSLVLPGIVASPNERETSAGQQPVAVSASAGG